MALVNITEAARLVQVSEKTVRRKIASGDLSAQVSGQGGQAKKVIDTSELMRVFGPLSGQPAPDVHPESPVMSTQVPDTQPAVIEPFRQIIETQKELISVLQTQLDARTQETRDLRAQVAGLLEYRRPEPASAAPEPVPAPPAVVQASLGRVRDAAALAGGLILILAAVLALAWVSGHLVI